MNGWLVVDMYFETGVNGGQLDEDAWGETVSRDAVLSRTNQYGNAVRVTAVCGTQPLDI